MAGRRGRHSRSSSVNARTQSSSRRRGRRLRSVRSSGRRLQATTAREQCDMAPAAAGVGFSRHRSSRMTARALARAIVQGRGTATRRQRPCFSGGEEIRTPGGLASTAVFKTAALDHSATPPEDEDLAAFPAPKQRQASAAVSLPHGSGARRGALSQDSVEAALAKSIEAATVAGRWDVVLQLARELHARRADAPTNVVAIDLKRGAGVTRRR